MFALLPWQLQIFVVSVAPEILRMYWQALGVFGPLAAGFLLMDQIHAGAENGMDLRASLVGFTAKCVI